MKKNHLFLLSATLLAGIAVGTLSSCGNDNPPVEGSSSVSFVQVESVVLSSPAVTLSVGETMQLTARISPSDATNQNVSYSSSDPSIATVSPTGLVTGVAEGTVSITVTTEDQTKTSSVTLNVGRAGYDYLGVNELS